MKRQTEHDVMLEMNVLSDSVHSGIHCESGTAPVQSGTVGL